MATKGHKKLNSLHSDEHDPVEYRKRVSMFTDGDTVSYEGTDFGAGDSPAVFDIYGDTGKTVHNGYFVNDGPGDIKLELSEDGTSYGGQHVLRGGDVLDFENLSVRKVRLTYVDDTEYRCMLG